MDTTVPVSYSHTTKEFKYNINDETLYHSFSQWGNPVGIVLSHSTKLYITKGNKAWNVL